MTLKQIIDNLQSLYHIEYDVKYNMLIIRDKIKVADFVLIKNLLMLYKIKVSDIRVI